MEYKTVYDRPYEINEPESLQNIIIKYVYYNIKSLYPKKNNHCCIT